MGKESLLKTLGYQSLIEMITPEETKEARDLLRQFLHDLKLVDTEIIAVLAYLFGVNDGTQSAFNIDNDNDDGFGSFIADKLTTVYNMGKQHGFYDALLLLGKSPKFTLVNLKQKNTPPDEGVRNN